MYRHFVFSDKSVVTYSYPKGEAEGVSELEQDYSTELTELEEQLDDLQLSVAQKLDEIEQFKSTSMKEIHDHKISVTKSRNQLLSALSDANVQKKHAPEVDEAGKYTNPIVEVVDSEYSYGEIPAESNPLDAISPESA